MAAQRNTQLADEQLVQLREAVAAGRRPRVRVSGPTVSPRNERHVLQVGDPNTDGPPSAGRSPGVRNPAARQDSAPARQSDGRLAESTVERESPQLRQAASLP